MPRSRELILLTVTAAGLLLLTSGGAAWAGGPEDARLQPVRARIEGAIDQTRRAGLPSELVNGKVREGLAKGAAPEAIAAAAERLAANLAEADRTLQAQRAGERSVVLLRALAEARAAGVDLKHVGSLIRPQIPETRSLRAVEVLTDLARRGYPQGTAALLVGELIERDPGSLGRVPAGLDAVRNARGVGRADAVDLVRAGVAGGAGSLEAALNSSRGDDSQGDHGNRSAEKKEKPAKARP